MKIPITGQSDKHLILGRSSMSNYNEFGNFNLQTGVMRIKLTILLSVAFFAARAQTRLAPTFMPTYVPWSVSVPDNANHTWQLRPFAAMSAGYLFVGGGLSYVSAPLGIALYRPLNNNFTTFAAATVAPAVFHFSSLYTGTPHYPGNNVTGLGVNAAVTGGLIYTNDAKTFSISGSISVERGSYPVYVSPASNPRKQY